MNKITFPLKQRTQGAAVADLQEALQLLLDRSVILASVDAAWRELSEAFKCERVMQTYGASIRKPVSLFQEGRSLQATGEVDEATVLNSLLDKSGLFDQSAAPKSHVVSGERTACHCKARGCTLFTKLNGGAIQLGDIPLFAAEDDFVRRAVRLDNLPRLDSGRARVPAADEEQTHTVGLRVDAMNIDLDIAATLSAVLCQSSSWSFFSHTAPRFLPWLKAWPVESASLSSPRQVD